VHYNNCSYYWLLVHSLRHATTLVLLLTNWVSSQKTWIWLEFTPFQRIITSFSIVPFVLVTHLYFLFALARIFLSCTHIICFYNFLCKSFFLKLCRIRNNGLFNSLITISWSFLKVGFYFIYKKKFIVMYILKVYSF